MKVFKTQWFQLIATFFLGAALGVWQLAVNSGDTNNSSSLSNVVRSQMDPLSYRNTAEIEPLLNITAPDKNASVDAWYQFALSLDDYDLGERYGNDDNATPLLSWYALIAKYKPQALYKLYNQGKLNEMKFNHLLRFGYLKYWDESVRNIDQVLLKNNQAVLTMAYNRGADATRQRVKQAFFKLAQNQTGSIDSNTLDIEILLFAMKGMTDNEKSLVPQYLESGSFKIDPRNLYRLKLIDTFKDESIIVSLIERYSKTEKFTNLEASYSNNKVLSSYMVDAALFGSERYIQTLIDDVEFNSDQPTDKYCAACGLALATDGLIAYPLINAAKGGQINLAKNPVNNNFIISRKGLKQ